MILRASVFPVLAMVVSVAVHLGGLAVLFAGEAPRIEGGAEASVARLGNAFQDMVVGEMTAARTDTPTKQRVTPDTRATAVPPTPAPAVSAPVTAARVLPTPPLARTIAPTITTTKPVPEAVKTVSPPLSAPQPATVETATQVVEGSNAPRSSPRPAARPDQIAAMATAAAPKEAPRKKTAAKKPEPKGNASRNAATGSSGGVDKARAAAAAPRQATATQEGNAASSNYRGKVLRRIERVRQSRNPRKGEAIVAFSITANGGLGALSIARSSGSDQLDRAALDVLRRAAPFPPPPSRTQTRFTVRVRLK
ncbi:energy transducer TonB family protein [Puniceibacterium sediminis]|uniref:Outer membrane transport energization protein TonB n=1 Tax=Puniceibacterium sediminis TaxID=1608407 RepID=A0A238YRW2_9RHOB|nr:TonB family protein [Puniceibacterium sediminis]SNR73558.1 outer membrane transport energization protein TonB [Puniceibacterium sediminis]